MILDERRSTDCVCRGIRKGPSRSQVLVRGCGELIESVVVSNCGATTQRLSRTYVEAHLFAKRSFCEGKWSIASMTIQAKFWVTGLEQKVINCTSSVPTLSHRDVVS